MKITRRQFGMAAGAGAAAFSLGMPAIGRAQSPLILKFSHVVTNDATKGKGALRFKELAEKYTGGKVKVEVYPSSQLYKDKEELEALQLGSVHILAPSTSKFAPLGVKEFEALDLPFIFPDEHGYQKATDGAAGKWLLHKLDAKGIGGLAFWDNGFHVVSANKPLIKVEDFKGLKFRISGSKVADQYFRQLGAISQILAFSELYQALQTGLVDGCENTPSNYYTQRLHDVQRHITVARHAHLQYAVIVNNKFWNGLPGDIREQLDKAMAEATDYTNSIARQENIDALEDIRKSGKSEIHVLSEEQRAPWRKAMMPVYKWAEGRVGTEVIDLLQKEVGAKS